MPNSQQSWIKDQLLTTGQVSRNQALQKYITRIAARILDLRNEGLEVEGKTVKTMYGKDYVYYLKQNKQLNMPL